MTANNISMYFKIVDPAVLSNETTWKKIYEAGELCIGKCDGNPVEISMGSKCDKLLIFKSSNGSHASLRIYENGLITVDVQHYIKDKSFEPLNMKYIRSLEVRIRKCFEDISKESNSIYTPIRRGQKVWPYAVTADERILEHDFDELLVDVDSRWQNIRIFHSKQFGNMLMLDGDSMLGESDLIYTTTVCAIGKENYCDKEVLILGGGDGGIIHELLKEKPKFITMVEIDEEVIKACRQHMRSVCGDSMDSYEGPHHQILIDDCVKYLHECIQEGKQFDYVINDLTEFPVDKAVKGYGYDFETTSLITEMSLKAVKPGGKLLGRGNCATAFDWREKFEGDVQKMGCKFLRKEVMVPSFEEFYCLYEIWRDGERDEEATINGHQPFCMASNGNH